MNVLKAGWSPFVITALALAGYMYEWPLEILAPGLIIILVVGLAVAATGGRERELERLSLSLKELAGYFNRRFAGNSPLSIFAIIDGLYNIDDPKVWDWARACDMTRRVFDTWCERFITRTESDIKTRRFTIYLRTYLNELWLIVSRYHEFVEQFCDVAGSVEVPQETVAHYDRFVTEYNAFVQHFREGIIELKKVIGTEIEPPSIKLARELPVAKPGQATREGEKEEKPPQPADHRGYIL